MITTSAIPLRNAGGSRRPVALATAALLATVLLTAGSASAAQTPTSKKIPQLSAAQPGSLERCTELASFDYGATTITLAEVIPAGALTNAGTAVGEHCLVQGKMNERTSPVDGQNYAIGFEIRLPTEWSGRYL